MPQFTHKNLNAVDDSADKFGYSELMEVRFASDDLETADTGVSHHRIKPGKRQGFGHKHENAEEVYVVITGSGRVKLDEDVVELIQLDAVRVEPGVMRQFEAGDEGMEMVAFGPKHEGDGEIVPDWWASDAE
jgi:mannose-6-phosphate isomerase-like protein (cupin superfamily)